MVAQTMLPGFDPPATDTPRKHRRRSKALDRVVIPDDDHISTFLRRLAAHGAAAKGVGAYQYQLRATVRAASRITGSPIDVAGLFRDPPLLGRAGAGDLVPMVVDLVFLPLCLDFAGLWLTREELQ